MKQINVLLFLVFFWIARNTILVRQRDTSAYSSIDAMALLQIAVVFLLFLLFFIYYKKLAIKTFNDIYNSHVLWFFLIYALGLVSLFWSPEPFYSGYRAFESLVLFFAIFMYFNSPWTIEENEKVFLKFSTVILLLTFFGQMKLQGFSFSIASLHTNSYSLIALIIFLYSFGELMSKSIKSKERKSYLKKYAYLSFLFILLGTSGATNISLVFGLLLLTIFSNRMDIKIIFIFALFMGLIIFFLIGDINSIVEILMPGKDAKSISTMTGRMGLWEVYIQKIEEKPFFGWGFAIIARISEHATTNTHNSLLSILTGVGGIGMSFFIFFIIATVRSIFINKKYNGIGNIGAGVALGGALLNAMSFALIGESLAPTSIAFTGLLAFYFLHINKKKTKEIK